MATAQPSRHEQAPKPANQEHASDAFEALAEPFRREIKLHCYRMLGSLHEADDLVQETYLRAWRSFSNFEAGSSDEHGSFRAWLYRIATNACLNALEGRKHQQRYLPDQLGPASPPKLEGGPALDVPWLEPYPDANLEGFADAAPNPEARYTARESVQLAFVAAIQQLPPRQRAALMLCDVLGWASAEAASLLGGSTASINSALQRARESLSQRYSNRRSLLQSQPTPAQQKLLGRYLRAWEGHDVDGFVAVLKEDATAVMPPWLQWFTGREVIGTFFAAAWKTCAASTWYRHPPMGSRLLPFMSSPPQISAGMHTPFTSSRLRTTRFQRDSVFRSSSLSALRASAVPAGQCEHWIAEPFASRVTAAQLRNTDGTDGLS